MAMSSLSGRNATNGQPEVGLRPLPVGASTIVTSPTSAPSGPSAIGDDSINSAPSTNNQTRLDLEHSGQLSNFQDLHHRKRQQLDKALRRRQKQELHVLDPSGSLYYHWSMVVSFAFLYNFWSLSYRFAFREIDSESMAFWLTLDYSADLVYVFDVIVNFRTGFLSEGVLERNMKKIGVHYRESTLFYLDCFCLMPFDFLYLSFGFNSILRCNRLVKIYKFWSYIDRTERHTNYPNLFRTLALVHYILVILHWNACIFHMISKQRLLDLEGLFRIADNRCDDTWCQYLHAFYWSTLALATVGNLPRPRTKGEYLFVTLELFFGLFLFASVLGHVANIVTNVSAARKEFQARLDNVKRFMRTRRVSDELQNKVIRWFDYLWSSQNSSDEDKSVACLPDRLKAEIAIQVHLDTLKRVEIFQNTEAGFLCELVLRLKPVLFSPGDFVCRKNEVGHEMYIVSRGSLEVVADEGGQVVATLKAGSYFGEISVLNVGLAGNKRTASVRSVGYSDLFCLKRQDLWDVLKNYPQAEDRIRARAEERLLKLDVHQSQKRTQRQIFLQQASLTGSGTPSVQQSHRRRVCSYGSRQTTANRSLWTNRSEMDDGLFGHRHRRNHSGHFRPEMDCYSDEASAERGRPSWPTEHSDPFSRSTSASSEWASDPERPKPHPVTEDLRPLARGRNIRRARHLDHNKSRHAWPCRRSNETDGGKLTRQSHHQQESYNYNYLKVHHHHHREPHQNWDRDRDRDWLPVDTRAGCEWEAHRSLGATRSSAGWADSESHMAGCRIHCDHQRVQPDQPDRQSTCLGIHQSSVRRKAASQQPSSATCCCWLPGELQCPPEVDGSNNNNNRYRSQQGLAPPSQLEPSSMCHLSQVNQKAAGEGDRATGSCSTEPGELNQPTAAEVSSASPSSSVPARSDQHSVEIQME